MLLKFPKNSEKSLRFHNNIKQHSCFHQEMIFEHQISILDWFQKNPVTSELTVLYTFILNF